jgi:hypothetical protein
MPHDPSRLAAAAPLPALVLSLLFATVPAALAQATAAEATDLEAPPRAADHVVLVSIDGLRPEFYLDPAWGAPMLRQLVAQGAHAEQVKGVFPSVTYPSHTTMVTGMLPARHGIYYNSPFEPDGVTGRWHWEASAITARTLWDAVRDADLTSAGVGWPVTVGAPIDYLIPEVWSLDPADDFIETTRAASHPPDLLAELEREATGRLTVSNFTIYQMTRDDRAGDIAAYLLATYRPNLLAVHLIETDHFQHQDGRDSWRVRRAVSAADRALSQIYEAAERAGILERTAFIVTGDHGHVDRHTRLAPNVLLAGAGLMGDSVERRGDWRAAFHTTAASAFLHLNDPADGEALAEVRRFLDALPRGVEELFRVLDRAELDRLGAAPEAALALALEPGIDVTSSPAGPLVGAVEGATHGYLPDASPQIYTGLVASGAGIRPGAAASRLRLTDIAPLIAHLLGLEMPAGDGVMPLGFLAEPAE